MLQILRKKFESEQHIIRKITKLKKGASKNSLLLLAIAPLAACGDGSSPTAAPPSPPAPAPDPTFTEDPANVWTAIDDSNSTLDESASTADLVVIGKAGDDSISTGSGNDIIRAGQGADTVDGGAGDDIFVFVGTTDAGEYIQADIDNAGGGIDLNSVLSLDTLNGQTVSEAATGETIDGGTGSNTLVIYGDVDLTDFTLTNVTNLVVNSTVTLTQEQIAQFTSIDGDGNSVLNIVIPAGSDVVLDLSAVDVSNIAEINIDGNVTVQVSNTADFSGIGAITVSDGSTLSLDIADDGGEGAINLQEIADVFVAVDTIVVETGAELIIDDSVVADSLNLTDVSGDGEVIVDASVDQGELPLDPAITPTVKGTVITFGAAAQRLDGDLPGEVGFEDNLEAKILPYEDQVDELLDYALDTYSWEQNGEITSLGANEIVISHTSNLTDYVITFTGDFTSTATTVTELFNDLDLDGNFAGTFDGFTVENGDGILLMDGIFTDNQITLSIPGAEAGQSMEMTVIGDFPRTVEVVRDIINGDNAHLVQDIAITSSEITVNGEVVASLFYDDHTLTLELGDFLLVAEGDFLTSKSQILSLANYDDIIAGDLSGLDFAVTSVTATRTKDSEGNDLTGDSALMLQLDVNGLDPVDLGSIVSKVNGKWVLELTQSTLDDSLFGGYDILDFSAITDPVFASLDANMSVSNLMEAFLPRDEFGEIEFPVDWIDIIDVVDVGENDSLSANVVSGTTQIFEGNTTNDLAYSVEEINGGQGDDIIHGSITDNIISGNAGDDVLIGSYGNDTINGGAGNDTLYGDDIFTDIVSENGIPLTSNRVVYDPDFVDEYGNVGGFVPVTADELAYGDNGQDTFVFDANWGLDTVVDFELANDILDLSSTGLEFADLQISTLLASEAFPDAGITPEADAAIGSIGTEITVGEDSIFLAGVDMADLTEAHFDFVV